MGFRAFPREPAFRSQEGHLAWGPNATSHLFPWPTCAGPGLDLAPGPVGRCLSCADPFSGCRDFNGPVPRSLLMKALGTYGGCPDAVNRFFVCSPLWRNPASACGPAQGHSQDPPPHARIFCRKAVTPSAYWENRCSPLAAEAVRGSPKCPGASASAGRRSQVIHPR